jgi:phosphatidate cytidylyltransferase
VRAEVAALRPDVTVIGSDLLIRTSSAAVLAAIALGAAWFGGPATGLVAAVAAVVVWVEWANITGLSDGEARILAVPVGVATIVGGFGFLSLGFVIAGGTIVGLLLGRASVWPAAGIAYAAVLGLCLLAIRLSAELGLTALFFVFAVVWATDTGAFFAGRTIGGAKLWPRVSPKKTWAGAIGGLFAAVLAAAAVAAVAGFALSPALAGMVVVLSLACQMGDLFESAVKRRFGVKDSGHIIPGHGGLMDRVDGLIFACALATLVGWVRGGADHIAAGLLRW